MPKSISSQKVIMDVGVILLVVGVMMPFSQGSILVKDLYKSFFATKGFISFVIGILSSVLARNGVELMSTSPEAMIGLLFGTVVGTAIFNGIPVGPLVAAGFAAFIINLLSKFT